MLNIQIACAGFCVWEAAGLTSEPAEEVVVMLCRQVGEDVFDPPPKLEAESESEQTGEGCLIIITDFCWLQDMQLVLSDTHKEFHIFQQVFIFQMSGWFIELSTDWSITARQLINNQLEEQEPILKSPHWKVSLHKPIVTDSDWFIFFSIQSHVSISHNMWLHINKKKYI